MTTPRLCLTLVLTYGYIIPLTTAWTSPLPLFGRDTRHGLRCLDALPPAAVEELGEAPTALSRRDWCRRAFGAASALGITAIVQYPNPSHALVKGSEPPPRTKMNDGKPKCTNVDECQAQAELREQQLREEAAANAVPISTTSGGIRFRDLIVGDGTTAKAGDEVVLHYKVLKLGKRSYDGISGEGTVVFSRGYGLEDDEAKPGDKNFVTTLGSLSNIGAVNDAVPGMQTGGTRRFAILPPQGWRKPSKMCDGGPGGSGSGGDLRTDYVIVPTATMVDAEVCFDQSKQPFPTSYGQQRRMAQRFDQSLIMEVQLVAVKAGGSL
ncbi:predicted protein [Phaeodactylum tricornutum CCAP 1055/1]|uniref:Uncharacterized protein n=1 Tax=Phaeodactylum tricornutum (strain CCAP 1055/1) TaxID=556484 RepID=B7G5J4_PHATC|nr:predicted protein [Phaeodactylum tricornutum CCAP 1055/1]EEC46158.1 predicted protein [Phaeodactylum tricornutum CCAP 1055/1]|eukprot:XP_002182257.1 predicted protein [Phaeodactylum tricornutum CCAP 1055/1]